jgi:hypothetical protein
MSFFVFEQTPRVHRFMHTLNSPPSHRNVGKAMKGLRRRELSNSRRIQILYCKFTHNIGNRAESCAVYRYLSTLNIFDESAQDGAVGATPAIYRSTAKNDI